MGSRSTFENVDLGYFSFKEDGQNYHTIGEADGIQVIIQDSGSVKAPEYSSLVFSIFSRISKAFI